MTERSADTDDVKTCPSCDSRDHLVIRWLPDIDHSVHEITQVGCTRCDKFFTGKEDRYPITEWNLYVIQQNKLKGLVDPHEELYGLLHEEFQRQQEAEAARNKVDAYLDKHVVPQCPFQLADRFKFNRHPGGIWAPQSVRAVYGTNTGPFWILTARRVSRSGRVTGEPREFWQRDSAHMKPIPPYWRPYRWTQVVEGDTCLVAGRTGKILHVDLQRRKATVALDTDRGSIQRLDDIMVPAHRTEAGTSEPPH